MGNNHEVDPVYLHAVLTDCCYSKTKFMARIAERYPDLSYLEAIDIMADYTKDDAWKKKVHEREERYATK